MNAEKAAVVLQGLAEGASLRAACADAGMKHPTFLLWVSENPELADQYARVMRVRADQDFEEFNEEISEEPERLPTGAVDPGWVAWKRVRLDGRKWSMGKRNAKKYGDRLDVDANVTCKVDLLGALKALREPG